MASPSPVHESELVSFFIYNPELGAKEGTEHNKLLYYRPENETLNRKVRNIGLCEAIINFTKTFNPDKLCESVQTERQRQVFFEPENSMWMVMTVSVPWAEVSINGEQTIEYFDQNLQDSLLQAALRRSYYMFRLFNGTFSQISKSYGVDGLRKRLDKFFSRYLGTIEINKLDIFSIFQGIQFLPLDKYMYLEVHCFVNQVETSFRNIQRTVFLFRDQLLWSGLEQEDIKIFYHYLVSWLLPSSSSTELTSSQITSSLSPSSSSSSSTSHGNTTAGPGGSLLGSSHFHSSSSSSSSHSHPSSLHPLRPGMFLMGQSSASGEISKIPWVYVIVDGHMTPCKLYVYNVGNATMCFFVQNNKTVSTEDFSTRLDTYLGPRLSKVSSNLQEYSARPRSHGLDMHYRFIYFNEMNLAMKSPLLSTKRTLSPEVMKLLVDVNLEYERLDEGETIIRTMSDYWVIGRKSGHRRFFVVLNQKNANFAEINDEVRRLCQKEFTNIFFLD